MVVGNGGAVHDASHAVDRSAAGQHCFAQDRFSGRRMPDDGKVADVRGTVFRHGSDHEQESARAQAWRSLLSVSASASVSVSWIGHRKVGAHLDKEFSIPGFRRTTIQARPVLTNIMIIAGCNIII